MSHFFVHAGNRLETLAERLFETLYAGSWPDPLLPRCIVTNSVVMQAWLRHFFVFDWSGRQERVLANCDFELLYPFVNDWMDRLLAPKSAAAAGRKRETRHHPYAAGCLQWRIYRLLTSGLIESEVFAPLRTYLDDRPDACRCFQLAGRLATLFDDYQIYRCEQLERWEQGLENAEDRWQAGLWRALTAENSESYAALFRRMRQPNDAALRKRFDRAYGRVAIFGTTSMPPPYVGFLQAILSRVVAVDLYVLNPSAEDWLDDVTRQVVEKQREALILEDHPMRDDPLMLPEQGHPLLCSLGRSLQEHLHGLEALSEGFSDTRFVPTPPDCLLHDLQHRIQNRVNSAGTPRAADPSLQVHICHNPRRELEVLRDYLLCQLTAKPLEPRHIQVLIPDIREYAPLIDAVFGTTDPLAPDAVPYVIEGRGPLVDSAVSNAFQSLLDLVSSRFAVSTILDLLRVDAVRTAFDIAQDELDTIESLVRAGGIRWGIDAMHRRQITGAPLPPQTSWSYGLDRLLAGYALGAPEPAGEPWPIDRAEGASAVALGKLTRFIDQLSRCRTSLQGSRPLAEWRGVLVELLETFFAATQATCREIASIRRVVEDLQVLSGLTALEDVPVPFDVIVSHLKGEVATTVRTESLMPNAVVFCQLRPMNSRPAEIVCVLGLNDGVFPRNDNRPSFDLLARSRCRGDRSLRQDDREAFLESIVNARQALFLSYCGRTDNSNDIRPPSVVLQELRDELVRTCHMPEHESPDGARLLPVEVPHRLQAAHPDYFTGGRLFSYSAVNLLAARQLAADRNQPTKNPTRPFRSGGTDAPVCPAAVEWSALLDFFENPARYYYRNVLDVNLRTDARESVLDEEPFEATALDAYQLAVDLLRLVEANGGECRPLPLDELIGRKTADGLLPLGSAGARTVIALEADTQAWLDLQVEALPGPPATLRELLRLQSRAVLQPASLAVTGASGAPITLRGALKAPVWNDAGLQLQARYATLKIRDRLRAWLTHLFACAVHPDPVRTLIVAKHKTECFAPLGAPAARRALQALVACHVEGLAGPLPFAPESAYAFCLAISRNPDAPRAMADGLRAAAGCWGDRNASRDFVRNEAGDDWLYHAFGEEGPMAGRWAERFALVARTVFDPLLAFSADSAAGEGGAA